MKKLFPSLLLFLSLSGYAQDKPVVITAKMFDPSFDVVSLDQLNGWYFRAGNDTAWAKSDISMAGWKKLNPPDLSAKYADKNGRVEGWFRIKLKVDPGVNETGFNIHYSSHAPADIFVNGRHVASAGNTGLYGHAFAECSNLYFTPGMRIPVKSGDEFVLALHITDALAPLSPGKLRSQLGRWSDVAYLGGESTDRLFQADHFDNVKSDSVYLSVLVVVCMLFWLFVILNRQERVFLYIALWAVAAVLNIFCNTLLSMGGSSSAYLFYSAFAGLSVALLDIFTFVIVARTFKRKVQAWVIITIATIAIYNLLAIFLSWPSGTVYNTFFTFGLSIYYIVSSWRILRGAQWSIVAGLSATFIFLVGGIILSDFFPDEATLAYFLNASVIFAFPLSLLVFVAMRFKEMLHEVKQNADEVVRLSEEKKQEALNRQKLLEEEVNRQTAEIRSNQARLIQSEKMASLGELTAGIAHEIQNPLNFVNNFSEVNTELLDEMQDEIAKGDLEEIKAIATDLKENEKKINMHGKRADAIVKGMLQHSRTSSGQKEPTDLNALANEYLRLAYHGLRAKDKDFNAELITNLDEKLPKVNVVPQDIGRVILNIVNNAFYAVQQRARTNGHDYKPQVEISTAQQNGSALISVKDNGNGIPDAIKDKIMQPFFTTKPTGEGTGLGLSLSYDIVVKGHNGEIHVDTKEGEFTEFTVTLPLS